MDGLKEIGWTAVTPDRDDRRGATVCVPSCDSAGLFEELARRDIVTSFRDDNLRASHHFYNNVEDVGRFIEAMKELRDRFRARTG
jgi:selenocysteine lyase/cysteine desulfurase